MDRISLVNLVQLLHNHGASSTTAVADSSHTILAGLQLVKEGHQDTGARATEGVANGDGTSQEVDTGVLETKNLLNVSGEYISEDIINTDLLVGLDDGSKSLIEFPDRNLVLGNSSTF